MEGLHQRHWVATVVITGVLCASPVRLRGPETGPATRLLAAMKQLNSAQVAFAATCGDNGFASTLDQLKTSGIQGGGDTFFQGPPPELQGPLDGMQLRLQPRSRVVPGPRDCRGLQTTTEYYASATFGRPSWKGPSFAMVSDGVIWRSETADPPREPFGAPATQVK